jgi:hypothetical protein
MSRLIPSLVLVTACGMPAMQETPSTPTGRTTLATTTADTLTAELSTTTRLSTGLTTVWVTLKDKGAAMTDATVTLLPVMTMPTKSHAAPVVGDVVAEGNGVYRGEVVFSMPSADMGTWRLDAKVVRGGVEKLVTFDNLAVDDSGLARSFTVTDPADSTKSTKFISSVSFPDGLKVGKNKVVVTLHTMKDMMTFPAFEGATIEMVPEMPAHGHGSSNNVAPTLVAPGRYEGTANYTMLGEWKTTFTLKSADGALTTFAITTTL